MKRCLRNLGLMLATVVCTAVCYGNDDGKGAAHDGPAASPKASFFLIGGAAEDVLADFVRLAGGEKANIAIITHASEKPEEAGRAMENAFTALNVKQTTVILPGAKGGIPKDANAIFFCGGDQASLKRLLDDTLLKQLRTFEGVIGGSSAGAMFASGPKMIARGMDEGLIKGGQLLIVDGLNLLPGMVIDTHVGQRSRDTRELAALALIPEAIIAIGLDEDTAIYVQNGKARVYGKGHARVFKRLEGFTSNIKEVKRGSIASVRNVSISVYADGDDFDVPAPAPGAAVAGDRPADVPQS